jgi:hypothetical protein
MKISSIKRIIAYTDKRRDKIRRNDSDKFFFWGGKKKCSFSLYCLHQTLPYILRQYFWVLFVFFLVCLTERGYSYIGLCIFILFVIFIFIFSTCWIFSPFTVPRTCRGEASFRLLKRASSLPSYFSPVSYAYIVNTPSYLDVLGGFRPLLLIVCIRISRLCTSPVCCMR